MWISTRALLVAMVLCVVMCLPHFEEMGLKVETGILILLGACVFWLCKPRKVDGDLFFSVLGYYIVGLWLSNDFSEFSHTLMIFLLPLSGSWLAGEFSDDSLPGRHDRLFVTIKYFLISVLCVWSICKGFGLVGPLYLHDQSNRWFGKGDAPLTMLWLLIVLAVFWMFVGLRLLVLKLINWLSSGK
jgi:hypothetical protein